MQNLVKLLKDFETLIDLKKSFQFGAGIWKAFFSFCNFMKISDLWRNKQLLSFLSAVQTLEDDFIQE